MILRIRTPSRLHFGLLAGRCESGRSFGGAGLMVGEPAVEVIASSSPTGTIDVRGRESVPSSIVDRARGYAGRLAGELGLTVGCRIEVRACPPEHVGLGAGTQLGMAVGWAVVRLAGRMISLERAADLVGRGRRSAIGVHGFAQGGLIVDGGKARGTKIAPLIARLDFPTDWPVLLITPPIKAGRHGRLEEDAFEQLSISEHSSAQLSDILLRRLLPAVLEQNLDEFSHALFDYNRTVGQSFSTFQGGVYADSRLEEIVNWFLDQGIPSAQSSWGPTLFAVLDSVDRATQLAAALTDRFALPPDALCITSASNSGASIIEDEDAAGVK